MTEDPNIVLVGFMGVGKTTVGEQLARRLGRPHVDTDDLIEAADGRTIAAIFAESGEPAFRQLEREAVRRVSRSGGQVITAGGGVVLDPENIRAFSENGVVICLRAKPETILSRVSDTYHRPLLEAGDKEKRVREILERRKGQYDAIPYQVATDHRTPEEVAEEVIRVYQKAVGPS